MFSWKIGNYLKEHNYKLTFTETRNIMVRVRPATTLPPLMTSALLSVSQINDVNKHFISNIFHRADEFTTNNNKPLVEKSLLNCWPSRDGLSWYRWSVHMGIIK